MKNIFTLILSAMFCNFTANSSPNLFSPATSEYAQIRLNLYLVAADGSPVLVDGTLTQYDINYNSGLDGMDARKMFNPSENCGMLRGSTVLIIERRKSIEQTDTIFFKTWNMRNITYKMEFVTVNLNKPGRTGVLEDNYLKTATPINLNDTTLINFSVTAAPESHATNRFRVVFSTPSLAPMPVTFTYLKAFQQNNSVNIDWKTANESNVKQYNIERSADDNHFTKSIDIKAGNLAFNNYHWIDANPVEGNNYYRITSIETDGKIKYSDVMKVYVGKVNRSIDIFPNPATGSMLNLQLLNQQPGLYEARLLNSFGQTFMSRSIQYSGGSHIENLKLGQSIPKGIYQLEVETPSGQKKVMSVVF